MKKTKEECEREGHEYSMVYNDGTTCMNCGYDRPFGEESGIIRSVSGVVVPALLCDLARALPMPVCPPEHTLREAATYCKSCDESRDELQQLVGDGDLNSIAIVVGVYLRRLYAEHEWIGEAMRSYFSDEGAPVNEKHTEMWRRFYNLENVFSEVLSESRAKKYERATN